MPTQSANLLVMIKAARIAGRNLLRDFLEMEHLQNGRKGAEDFVAKAALRTEELIKEALDEARPTYGWQSASAGMQEGKDPTRYWSVDPLDGVGNFKHAFPQWAISIALMTKGVVTAAVIYDPLRSEIFTAEKGAGAWSTDRRMRVSSRTDFSDMMFATSLPDRVSSDMRGNLSSLGRVIAEGATIRRSGSICLDLVNTAAGRVDGCWDNKLEPWQLAAGELIVREAGGYAYGYDGETAPHEAGSVIATNPEVIEKLRELVRGSTSGDIVG